MQYSLQIFQETNFSIGILIYHKCRANLCSFHATYVFQSESTLYSCLNVKALFA